VFAENFEEVFVSNAAVKDLLEKDFFKSIVELGVKGKLLYRGIHLHENL